MFMGMFLSTIASMEDRQQLCEAAIGYSLLTRAIVDKPK
jgi:hypothetical protein